MLDRLRKGVVLGIALSAAPLLAHDLWIEPSSFSPRPGQVVGLRLRVGVDLQGEPLALIPALVNRFVVDDTSGRRPVAGQPGADPAGALRVAGPGLHVVGYHSHASRVELAAAQFEAYLAEEGLDAVTSSRARRHETGAPAREIFFRCAKSLVLSGPPDAAQRDRRLGFPLELVAERSPHALSESQDFPVRLTYADRPLAGALVVALNSLNPAQKQALRTDADGRVQLRLRPGGMWLVKAVHMVPAPAGAGADWASYWASLTFEATAAGAETK